MSSKAERAPKAGAQAKAEEASLLEQIGKRAPSPTQAVKVCQILGLATRENIRLVREIARNKNAFEAENKKPEGKKMEVRWGVERQLEKLKRLAARCFKEKSNGNRIITVTQDGILFSNCDKNRRISVEGSKKDLEAITYSWFGRSIVKDNGEFQDILISVNSPYCLRNAKKFAQAYEELTGKNADIVRDYSRPE